MTTHVGDVHNFGRQVKQVDIDGSAYFLKPRPIINELFLFGANSPLKTIILENLKEEKAIRAWNGIFSLEGQYKEMWTQKCGAIKSLERIGLSEIKKQIEDGFDWYEDFSYQFGTLMAYSFIMGIEDLNFENYIVSKKGLHVIDAEVAFESISFLSDTLCIGRSQLDWQLSGFMMYIFTSDKYLETKQISESDFNLNKHLLTSVLKGYTDAFDLISNSLDKVILATENFFKENKETPFRVIMRNTSEYGEYLFSGKKPEMPFLKEEQEQLDRKDIPYFFTTYSDRGVFYIQSSEGKISPRVDFPVGHPFWLRLIMIRRFELDRLLTQEILEKKRAQGCIEIYRELDPALAGDNLVINQHTKLKKIENKIKYHYHDLIYEGDNRPDKTKHGDYSLNLSIVKSQFS